MNKKGIATIVALSTLVLPFAADAKIDKPAKDWQVKSLKGIKSIKYCVAFDADGSLLKIVDSGLSGLKVPAKSVKLKEEDCCSGQELSNTEGMLKVYVDNRANDMAWVGLSIQQKSQLSRNADVSYDANTYALGSLVARAKAKDMIKELCAQFTADFKSGK